MARRAPLTGRRGSSTGSSADGPYGSYGSRGLFGSYRPYGPAGAAPPRSPGRGCERSGRPPPGPGGGGHPAPGCCEPGWRDPGWRDPGPAGGVAGGSRLVGGTAGGTGRGSRRGHPPAGQFSPPAGGLGEPARGARGSGEADRPAPAPGGLRRRSRASPPSGLPSFGGQLTATSPHSPAGAKIVAPPGPDELPYRPQAAGVPPGSSDLRTRLTGAGVARYPLWSPDTHCCRRADREPAPARLRGPH